MKHLRITVGEYTYGLPLLPFCDSDHGIEPIKYRILKRIDSHLLPYAILWECLIMFHHKFRHSKDSFILIHYRHKIWIWNMPKPQSYLEPIPKLSFYR